MTYMTDREVIQVLKGVLIINHKEREAVKRAIEIIEKHEKIVTALNRILYESPE